MRPSRGDCTAPYQSPSGTLVVERHGGRQPLYVALSARVGEDIVNGGEGGNEGANAIDIDIERGRWMIGRGRRCEWKGLKEPRRCGDAEILVTGMNNTSM